MQWMGHGKGMKGLRVTRGGRIGQWGDGCSPTNQQYLGQQPCKQVLQGIFVKPCEQEQAWTKAHPGFAASHQQPNPSITELLLYNADYSHISEPG